MRIAIVSDWFLPRLGGIELQVRDLAVRLQAHGHQVEIITGVPGPACVDGLTIHRLDAPGLPGAGVMYTAGAFRELRALLASRRFDIVHVHFGIIAPVAYAAVAIALMLGLPAVATFHSVLSGFDGPLRAVRGILGIDPDRVHWSAVSRTVADSMRRLAGGRPVAVLPNGIDVDWWRRDVVPDRSAPATRQARPLRAVTVMRLHRRKRPLPLVRALAAARRSLRPGQALELMIIGDGEQRRDVEHLVAREGLGDVVLVAGWLPRSAVRDVLHESDVFILPSRLEAFGIAALEARCAGLPVVAMQASGARDYLVAGDDALLARDDDELTRHLASLAQDGELLARLTRGAAVPPSNVGWNVTLTLQEELYRRAVDGHRPAAA